MAAVTEALPGYSISFFHIPIPLKIDVEELCLLIFFEIFELKDVSADIREHTGLKWRQFTPERSDQLLGPSSEKRDLKILYCLPEDRRVGDWQSQSGKAFLVVQQFLTLKGGVRPFLNADRQKIAFPKQKGTLYLTVDDEGKGGMGIRVDEKVIDLFAQKMPLFMIQLSKREAVSSLPAISSWDGLVDRLLKRK